MSDGVRLGVWGRRLRQLLDRRRWRRELEEEMELHLELRARESGAAAAERAFGNRLRLRERSGDMWGWRWLESLEQDARHGLRLLARTPVVTALALVSLTLGIGANTALFSLTDAVLLRSLPVAHPEQLAQVFLQGRRASATFTNPLWEQIRDHGDVFSSAFAWATTQFNLNGDGVQQVVSGVYASGDYFSTLGVQAERGRLFRRADDYRGCPAVADIGDGFWRSHFGASPGAVGATLMLSGHPFQVIGITPATFFGTDAGQRFDVAVPLCAEMMATGGTLQSLLDQRDGWWLMVMGRLRPGLSAATAGARLAAEAPGLLGATVPPDYDASQKAAYLALRVSVQPAANGVSWLRGRYGLPLEILLAISGLVLLIACANLAGLMLARSAARRQEIAVRMAMGATRGRLVRQMLTESLLLACGGAGLGAIFAVWTCAAMERALSPGGFEVSLHLTPDARVLGFTAALTAATALLIGVVPALRATRPASARTGSGAQEPRSVASLAGAARPEIAPAGAAGYGMIAVQVALALVLVAGSGVFLRSFLNLTGVDTGFDPSHVLLLEMNPPLQPLPDAAQAAADRALLTHLRTLPGVAAASQSFMIPTSGLEWDDRLETAGGAAAPTAIPDAYYNAVSPGYFATLRTPVRSGREFKSSDNAASAPVALVNAAAARQLFPQGDALGGFIRHGDSPTQLGPAMRIVGIVADTKYLSLREQDLPMAYFPLAQLKSQFPTTSFELRSALPTAALESEVRAGMAQFAPSASFRMGTLAGTMAGTIKPERLLAMLSALLGGLALLLSAIGIYGAMSYSAQRRRREFGIRMALGARPQAIASMVLAETAAMLAAGTAAGAGLTWLGARAAQAALGDLLFGLKADDALTLAAAVAVLTAAALAAALLPARRAARADPMASLREN